MDRIYRRYNPSNQNVSLAGKNTIPFAIRYLSRKKKYFC
jgi:hypothetical protein